MTYTLSKLSDDRLAELKTDLGLAEWGSPRDAEAILQELIDKWHPILAQLQASRSEPSEPVAWEVRRIGSKAWTATYAPDRYEHSRYERRPLFTYPANQMEATDAMIEAAAVALFRYDYPQDRWDRFGQKDYHPERYRAKARNTLTAALSAMAVQP